VPNWHGSSLLCVFSFPVNYHSTKDPYSTIASKCTAGHCTKRTHIPQFYQLFCMHLGSVCFQEMFYMIYHNPQNSLFKHGPKLPKQSLVYYATPYSQHPSIKISLCHLQFEMSSHATSLSQKHSQRLHHDYQHPLIR